MKMRKQNIKRFAMLVCVLVAIFGSALSQRPAHNTSVGRPPSTGAMTKVLDGVAITVRSVERPDEYRKGKVHLVAPEGEDIIVVNLTADPRGPNYVSFEEFELAGVGGVRGHSLMKKIGAGGGGDGNFPYQMIVEYTTGESSMTMYRDSRAVAQAGLQAVFTIAKGTRLKSLKLGTLTFDISRARIIRSTEP
jgi:hypothetical protein